MRDRTMSSVSPVIMILEVVSSLSGILVNRERQTVSSENQVLERSFSPIEKKW